MMNALKISGRLEALSYLLLLFVAMPLKYGWDRPEFVRWTGSAHGALFCLFCALALVVASREKWSLKVTALAFLSAFLPFGPFVFEKKYLSD